MNDDGIFAIERPHPNLRKLYVLRSLWLGPMFPALLVPLLFRYNTLRYRFDDEGVSMSWGVFFRREIHLTYARIQDIHLVSGFLQRWLGLADVLVQTASGNAGAEMTIEGLTAYSEVRDFLYRRMRGGEREHPKAEAPGAPPAVEDETVALLRGMRDDLAAVRAAVTERGGCV